MSIITKSSRLLLACVSILISGVTSGQDFRSSIILEEDRPGFCNVDGSIDSNRPGFTGSGHANTDNKTGAGIDWNITVSASGNYRFTWRYSNISYVNLRSAELLVDGYPAVSAIDFPGTGSWSTWDTLSIQVNLTAGNHTITLRALSGSGLVNVDNLTVAGAGVAPGNCSGEPPPSTDSIRTITIEENATGFCRVEGSIDTHRTGFTGSGFANSDNAVGAGIDWSISVPSSGSYILTWRYSNISNVNLRPAELLVDGRSTSTVIDFPGTGSWSTWGTLSVTVNLSAGQHLLRLQSTTGSGLVNIDNLKVRGNSPRPAGCSTPAPPAPTPIVVPESLPYTSVTVQENSTAFCGVDGSIDNGHTGYTGSGYANTDNAVGKSINWGIDVPASGSYKLTWRYANISNSSLRPGRLFVDGRSVVSNINFPGTGSWSTWGTVSVSVDLTAGNHVLRLEATSGLGLANIDSLKVGGYGPRSGVCGDSKPTPVPGSPTSTPIPTPPPATTPVPVPGPTVTPTPVVNPPPTQATFAAAVAWQIPTKRENGESLRLGDIGGYEIMYRQTGEVLFNTVVIRDQTVSQYVLRNLKAGRYEIMVAVFDTMGLYSEFSEPKPVDLGN